jgi:hypothetical protein
MLFITTRTIPPLFFLILVSVVPLMDDEDLRIQLELLNQWTDPEENNLSTIFNSNNTNTAPISSNDVTDNTFLIDQSLIFSPAPVNIPINPRTSNVVPAMIPTPSIPIQTSYPTTYYNVPYPPSQNPAIWPTPAVVENPEPNWEAINAFLRGQVRPGADVKRLYKCCVCGAEYANAQALGGHMGMHRKSKNQRGEGTSSKTGHSKKPRHR